MKPNLYLNQLVQYTIDADYIATLFAFYALASLIDITPRE